MEKPMKTTEKTCDLCGYSYTGYGNNAEPVINGRCCDYCNGRFIMLDRLSRMIKPQRSMERPTTTFHMDFRIAEHFGINAVKDTYKRAFGEWKTNYLYLTELVIVLNHRCWMHYDKGNQALSKLYAKYYYEAREYALDNLKGDEFQHFYEVTD